MSMRSLNKFSRMASASTWSFCKIVMQFWIVRWISPLECLVSISFTSVSYTHLDVYKRQCRKPQHILIIIHDVGSRQGIHHILAKQKEQLSAQQSKLDELTLKVSDMETLLEDVSVAAYDKAVEVVTDVVRTETRKEDMRMIEDTKKWVLSPERKAPKATREYAAHRLDTVLDKFLKTMQTTATRLQEKLLKPEVRQKGKEQVKEKARNSVLQLLNRLQAEQTQRKPSVPPAAEKSENCFQ